jgi:hypothetical protein
LFQTVFDQDFTLQTANAVFDMTVGLSPSSSVVTAENPTIDANGKYLFSQETLMMREKMDIYRMMAQNLLGDADEVFSTNNNSTTFPIKEAAFICFKRLFARDQIKRETFALRFNPSASASPTGGNLAVLGDPATKIITDINSSTNKLYTFGGQVSTVVNSADTTSPLGLLFIDRGILVLDMSRSLDFEGPLSGVIDAVNADGFEPNFTGSFRSLLVSASIDDIVDHVASTRFSGSGDETAITFQNITNINSTIYFARLGADEFNYSSNPTYTDADNRIVVIDEGQEETQQSFTFVTSIGLYDANDNLLAVAKVSRPILKANDRETTLKLRLDF